ncbi:MAG: hypothetical protein M1828_006322 [Chrysothrix sp. TS-e1954]|nr:MAG: hypothetical protein M1828_006322 [Chrysothrix sp. TS-e1954]
MRSTNYLSLIAALAPQALCAPVAQSADAAAAAPAPPSFSSVSAEKNVTSSTQPAGHFYARDGGTYGHIGTTYFSNSFDTSLCPDSEAPNCPSYAASTFSYLTSNPAVVRDPAGNTGLCNTNTKTGAKEHIWLGETVPLTATTGLTFFNNITVATGEVTHNTGPAIIDISNDTPTCTRVTNGWWAAANNVPSYGTAGTVVGHTDDFIYVFGERVDGNSNNIYVARVLRENAKTRADYTYWNGNAWVAKQNAAAPVITNAQGGSISFNEYLGGYIYLDSYIGSIYARLAPSPEGPWSSTTTLFEGGPLLYQPQAQVNYDLSGRTTNIKYSHASQEHLQKVRTITWS